MPEQEQTKSNLIYFECSSMRELYDCLENWQITNQRRFLSLSIQLDKGNFCCIALTDSKVLARQKPTKTEYETEMARFERKAVKHIGVGVTFDSDIIPPEKVKAIRLKLAKCTTQTEVRMVFADEF
jgi:hypothetical protein